MAVDKYFRQHVLSSLSIPQVTRLGLILTTIVLIASFFTQSLLLPLSIAVFGIVLTVIHIFVLIHTSNAQRN